MADVQFFLTRSDTCAACGGSGKKYHPNRQKWLDWKAQGRSQAEFFSLVSEAVWPPADLEKPIRDCPKCNGAGHVRSECSLADALSELSRHELID